MFDGRGARLLIAAALLTACTSDATTRTAATPTLGAGSLQTPEPTATPLPPTGSIVGQSSDSGSNRDSDIAPTEKDADVMSPTPTVPSEPDEPAPECVRLTDFATDAETFAWFVVNDDVMGGRSSGSPAFADSAMTFEGEINTDGGGFSSVRVELGLDELAGFTGLEVRARTDGREYKVILEDRLESRDRRISQQVVLPFSNTTDWQTTRVAFADLDPKIFGRAVETEAFRPDLASQLGIMISDGLDGPFRIEIDWIDACRRASSTRR